MAEQQVQWIATIVQDASNVVNALGQEIIQEVATLQQQVESLLGINPNPQTQSINAAVTRPSSGSGSGSGSGATTTAHDGPAQPLDDATPQTGSGSGSGSGMGSGSCSMYNRIVQFDGISSVDVPEEAGMCTPNTVTLAVSVLQSSSMCPAISVDYATQDGSATAGTDYTAESGTLSFTPGQSSPDYVTIPILDDGTDESVGSESFTVNLSSPVNAILGNPSTVTVNIEEGPQQAATDTLRWNPCNDNFASTVTNWYDVTQGFQLQKGAIGPNPSSPIQFDANSKDTPNSNAQIIWDQSFKVASISLNQYTGSQIIDPDDLIESTGTNSTSLSMDGNSWLVLGFESSLSRFQIDNGATITNMQLTGSGQFIIAGGQTLIGGSSNYLDQIGVNFYIYKGASLLDLGYTPLYLTSDPIKINIAGEMIVQSGTGGGMVLIDSGANSDDYIDVIGGTLSFTGTGGQWDYFNVPMVVESGGTFEVFGGTLKVKGTNTTTHSVSVYMKDSSSSVQLSKGAILECDDDYRQDSGTLETTDSSECTLKDGSTGNGSPLIRGGSVIVDDQLNTYGILDVQASGLEITNSTLKVYIEGYKPGNANPHDQLNMKGGSLGDLSTDTLTVGVDGTPQKDDVWLIITSTNPIQKDFGTKNSDPQTNGLTYGPINQPNAGDYQVQMPKS